MYLKYGPDLDEVDYDNPVKTVDNIRPETFNNSVWVPTSPCSRYKLEIASSMAAQFPGEYDADRIASFDSEEVMTKGDPNTIVAVKMEEGSTVLAWEFDKKQEQCFSDTQIR